MKYLLIFFYFSQVCATIGSGAEGPPYFYMQSFDSYSEAYKKSVELEKSGDGQGAIVYGLPQFGARNKEDLMPLLKDIIPNNEGEL